MAPPSLHAETRNGFLRSPPLPGRQPASGRYPEALPGHDAFHPVRPVTAARVADAVGGRSTAAQAVVTAKTAYHAAVVAEEQKGIVTGALLYDVRQCILAMFPTPEILSDCGVSPTKHPAPLTPEQRVVRAAKAKATRLDRGTIGVAGVADPSVATVRVAGTVPLIAAS